MKISILLFGLLFSIVSLANADVSDSNIKYTAEDFDAFPLTTSNSNLIEGTWIGKSVVIEVQDMNFTYDDKPYMWVTIFNKTNNEEKSALLYFNGAHDSYELYIFGLRVSVPVELMIFKYTDLMAYERNMRCKKGGYVMKILFTLEGGDSQTIELQRETCSDL